MEMDRFAIPDGVCGLLRSGRVAALLSVLIVAGIGATAGLMIWHDRQSAYDEALRGMRSMGIILAEQTGRHVQVIDLIMMEVKSRAAGPDVKTPMDFQRQMGTREVQDHLAERVRNVPQVNAIAVIGADGLILNSSRAGPVPRLNVADRDYYTWFRDHDDPGMFIGSLSRSRLTNDVSLFFARRVSGPDGGFLGLILAVVDVGYLSDFYQATHEHGGRSVTLLRRDGAMLMRYPNPAEAIGVKLPPGSPWHGRVAAGGGVYVTPGVLAATPSLVTVHPLRDYPLVIDVLEDEALALARWRVEAAYIASFALAAILSLSGLLWVVAWRFRLQAEQNAKLEGGAASLRDSQESLRAYAEMSVDWFWEQDADLRFKFDSNIPFMVLSNDTGKTRRDLGDPAMGEERWIAHEAALAARVPFRDFRWERIGSDGVRHFMSTNGNPVFDRDGVFCGYRGTGRDITADVRAHERLARANAELELGRQRIEAVLTNITHGVCLFDGAERLLVWNRRYTEIYDLPAEAACVGRSLGEILDHRDKAGSAVADMSPSDYLAWRDDLGAARGPSSRMVTLKNGRVVVIHYQPMSDGGWVATHEDITERRRAEAHIAFMAQHDALTRLANRTLFQDRLEQAIAMAGRGHEFAVFCLDLDHFKAVNDTLGHPVGDGLLRAVADRLRACVREGDTVARLGGDEFAIIQLEVGQPGHARLLANRVIDACRDPFDVQGHQIAVGISIGVAVAPGDGASSETLLKNADVALYLAKTEGRGTVRFFEPEMDARLQMRRTLELDLRDAIPRDEFELYYQPLVNLAAGRITGFEALLRWHHPIRGLVSPAEFIPAAEETGMIMAIGEWVLRTACFEARNWPGDISVAVNLSPVQFRKGDLVATVRAALAVSGLRPDRLELEITETVVLHDTVGTLTALHQLRAMGITVALDDFGTGYSSLSYLRSFPFDKIKIDQSFVRGLVSNKESMSIVRAVTGLGHSLGMRTTAEGVETWDQLNSLREQGCTEVQGYLFSRPRPASELPLLIEELQRIGEPRHASSPAVLDVG